MSIEIAAEVTVPLLLDGRCIMTSALVSPDIEEAHNCLWDFGRDRLYIDGRAAATIA